MSVGVTEGLGGGITTDGNTVTGGVPGTITGAVADTTAVGGATVVTGRVTVGVMVGITMTSVCVGGGWVGTDVATFTIGVDVAPSPATLIKLSLCHTATAMHTHNISTASTPMIILPGVKNDFLGGSGGRGG